MATARMTDDLLKKLCDKFRDDYRKVNKTPTMSEDLGIKIYDKYVKPMFTDFKEVYEKHMKTSKVFTEDSRKDMFKTETSFTVHIMTDIITSDAQRERVTKCDSDGYKKEIDWQLRDYVTSEAWDTDSGDQEIHSVNFELPNEVEMLTDKYSSAMPVQLFRQPDDELYRQCVDEWLAIKNANMKLKNDTKEYFNTLDRFETLNQALKAWPQLANAVEAVMPEKMVAVHKRTERKKKQVEHAAAVENVSQKFNNVMLGSTLLGDDDE